MTVEHVIHIEAPPDVVWDVTVDVERWPSWTPTVTAVRRLDDGPLGIGSRARIEQPGQPASVWTVTDYVPGSRFAWATRRVGLRMTAVHALRAEGSGTSNTLRVEAEGVLALLLWPLLRPLVARTLAAENGGLKARCEGGGPGVGTP